jgi:hypothetical protein
MAITKFHEKNIAILAKIETTSGTYNAPAATDAIAATTMDGSVTYETGSYQYLGDSLSRDEYTFQKDSYADVSVETPQQVLGSLNAALAVNDAPLSEAFQACGGYVTVLATAWDGKAAGSVIIDNVTESNSSLSIDYRKTSSEDLVNQKLYKFTACRGMVDVSANLGDVPKLKFAFKGNAADPIASPIIQPNFGAQTTQVAATVRQSSIVSATIATAIAATSITYTSTTATVTAPGHGLSNGNSVTVSGATGVNAAKYNGTFTVAGVTTDTFTYTMSSAPSANATGSIMLANNTTAKTFCFSTLQATNFFGFDYQRYLTGCEEGFAKGAVPTDVTVSMLEDQIGGTAFDPDSNVSKFFAVSVKFGSGAGKYVTYRWNKLQLANVKAGKVGTYLGRDVTFRNTGKSYIIFE